MPSAVGFPTSPTAGDQFPAVSPTHEYDGSKWFAIGGTSGGGSTPVTLRLTALTNTDDFIALRNISSVLTPHLVSAAVLADYAGAAPSATAPAAFAAGQWALTAITGGLRFSITALPSDGGSAITALEYRLNSGSWVAFAGTGTGDRDVTSLPTTLHTAEVRAVNAVGAGAASDTKSATPAAGGGGGSLTIVQAPAAVTNPYSTTLVVTAAAFAAGHAGALVVRSSTSSGTPTAMDSNGDSWTNLYSVAGPDEIYSFFVRNGVAAGVTSVTVTGLDAAWEGAVVEVSGQGAGLVLDGAGATAALASSSTHNVPFTSTAEAVVLVATSLANAATSTGTPPLAVKSAAGEYGCVANGLFPTPGAQNATFSIVSALPGQYARVALKAS